MIATTDACIDALKTVEAEDIEPFILRIGADRQSRRVSFADDLDGLPLLKSHRCERLVTYPSYAAPCIAEGSIRYLETFRLPSLCHCFCPIGELSAHAVASTAMSAERRPFEATVGTFQTRL